MRHRGKSLIIGAILFLGAFLMTVGNGVTSGMDAGLQKNIVEGFCGDAVLVSEKQESDNVFLDAMGHAVQKISNYKAIDSALTGFPSIKKWLPIGKNFAMVLGNSNGGPADGVFIIGVNYRKYREFFGDNLKLIEGTFPEASGPFVMIPTGLRKQQGENNNILLKPEGADIDTSTLSQDIRDHLSQMSISNSVVYMGMNEDNSTTDVRVPVLSIIKYRSLNGIWGNFPLVDIESYRECQGYFSAASRSDPVKKEDLDLLSASDGSLDDLFRNDNMVAINNTEVRAPALLTAGSLSVERDSAKKAIDLEAGVFNLVLLRFKEGLNLERAVTSLNKDLEASNLGVRAISWKKATGLIGSLAVLIKASLFAFVIILFIVAIIIIINTLSMAAMERTSEIGMMRAVGAPKYFIRLMFLAETGALSALFGSAGIIIGIIIIKVVAGLGITTSNDMVQLLYGGDTLRPLLTFGDIGLAVIQLIVVTLIAVVYPIRVASAITPLDAISRE